MEAKSIFLGRRHNNDMPVTAEAELADVIPFPLQPNEGDFSLEAEELTWVRERTFDGTSGNSRVRKTGFIAVHGYLHLVRVSEPDPELVVDSDDVATHVLFPGWMEAIDAGTAKNLHNAIADEHPDEWTISIATDGHSVHGNALPGREALSRSFDNMAADRLTIISRLAGDGPAYITGTSMGSVLAVLAAGQNLKLPRSEQINLKSLQLLSPGVIASKVSDEEKFRESLDSARGRAVTFGKFAGHMCVDSVREGFKHPKEAAEAIIGMFATGASVIKNPGKGAAIAGNLIQLLEGTPWDTLKEVASNYQVYILTGSKDTLREEAQWQTLQKLCPDNVQFKAVRGKGHALSLGSRKTAAAIRPKLQAA